MIWTEGLGLAVTLLSVWKVSVVEHNITSDSYFYELFEPVCPSPIGNGTGDWAEAYAKARAFISQLTLEENNNLTYGISTTSNACSGVVAGIPRLGFPRLCFEHAGNGVRYADFVNNYPSGIHVGASRNKSLAYDRACGVMGGEGAKGMQAQGVIASVKQELYSKAVDDAGNYTIEAVSSNIDNKTIQELYLWPFRDSIKAEAGNIMCSYNRVNNSFGCQNSTTMNGLPKTELGFSGFTVSDWNAQHSGVAASIAGLDMAMPDGQKYWGNNFTEAYANGGISVAHLDNMPMIISAWYKMGQDGATYPAPGVGVPYNIRAPHRIVNALDTDAKPTLFEGAVEGHVLVKNTNDVLPLKSPSYCPSSATTPKPLLSAVSQVEETFGTINFASTMLEQPYDFQVAFNGTVTGGGGSGSNTGPYISAPLDALQQRASQDNTVIMWDTENTDDYMALMEGSDACLVFINAFCYESSIPFTDHQVMDNRR
ncbi:hypothetical protein ANOM_009728 [Aspergillus nomiae NRRL 13137]|uniref:Probable beta-glucosidase M n=1 Tax=Aspergillus nomiae NRRL (strain ATCC 15546 / NRRL 13137 / CBS 260.88 / M93) TaxID=1509407 RepID=A0A0L1IR40_ASPN3|nr:uncharacterized protein ANOM_009728 [Aspergillus nomiae NRRL 13137]KNG81934.1 hypothetical protein ANOM_009728 [Aspergillus nomiae NRRL 13137]